MSKIRVGIDVGGTFTDVVAIDANTNALLARVKVPTTHGDRAGVAAGIVAGIRRLLDDPAVDAAGVAFIAHSTTQATNALLEGDLAKVGVVGLLDGLPWLARRQMRFEPLALGDGTRFAATFAFVSSHDDVAIRAVVDGLVANGAEAIAASESFGVDRPEREELVVAYARERGVDATSGHDVSTAYGLRARTRTAALNAAILPRMMHTARLTAEAVESAAIPAPLMVMRSDGGVMDVREIERRPILTLLSGPAAGVAGALLYERLTDGIFVEVGGTSSDCSAIRAGRPQMHPATIGGHRTMLRTLDVRTVGIGGGSMMKIGDGGVIDVGPRSAHIAGCVYASFASTDLLAGARVEREGYVVLVALDGTRVALTVTCAANALGVVPEGAFAAGNAAAAKAAFEVLAREAGAEPMALAQNVLAVAAAKLRAAVESLIDDYALDRGALAVVGGGGGAGALVPAAASSMRLPFRIARDAEVIAPIGVALALVRDVVERTMLAPSTEELAQIRREAADRVVAAGAAPDRVEVELEIDSRRNRVRATAFGATALVESSAAERCDEAARRTIAAASLHCAASDLEPMALTPVFTAFLRRRTEETRLRRREVCDVRVVDERGSVRLALQDPAFVRVLVRDAGRRVREEVERATRFGDVGRALPAIYLVRAGRIAAYEGLTSADQAAALVDEETGGCAPDEPLALIVVARDA